MSGAISTITAFAFFHHVGYQINSPVRKRFKDKWLRDIIFLRFRTFLHKEAVSITMQTTYNWTTVYSGKKPNQALNGLRGDRLQEGLAALASHVPQDRSVRQSRKTR